MDGLEEGQPLILRWFHLRKMKLQGKRTSRENFLFMWSILINELGITIVLSLVRKLKEDVMILVAPSGTLKPLKSPV